MDEESSTRIPITEQMLKEGFPPETLARIRQALDFGLFNATIKEAAEKAAKDKQSKTQDTGETE